MPVFEGLFPDSDMDELVQDVLYISATWHAYAKMRMHTDTTLGRLCEATRTLGHLLRKFSRETENLEIRELDKEKEARARRKAKKAAQKPSDGEPIVSAILGAVGDSASEAVQKILNLFTYKFHALGDYVVAITDFGTIDNYSTQTVSCT
jgi:hypothetical protein